MEDAPTVDHHEIPKHPRTGLLAARCMSRVVSQSILPIAELGVEVLNSFDVFDNPF